MKKSLKTVKIDLLTQSQKRNKSPSPSRQRSSPLKFNSQQFSFSHQDSPFLESKYKLEKQRQISRNLFRKSPEKKNIKTTSPYRKTSPQQKLKEFLLKAKQQDTYKNDRLYKNKIAQEEYLKKPLDKIKTKFFNTIRNNKLQTIRTLKEIGSYAEKRSREKLYKERDQKQKQEKPRKPIPVQFYGFDPQDNKPYSPFKHNTSPIVQNLDTVQRNHITRQRVQTNLTSRQRVETAEKGTYFRFQDQLSKHLATTDVNFKRLEIESSTVRYNFSPESKDQTSSQVTSLDNINKIQIETICQIFQMCEKYDESARLLISQFFMLLQQFERLYFIKIIQQSEANDLTKQKIKINQSDFYELLKRFEQSFKMVFYRREACDVYDCLYYLKESGKLDRVCSLFLGIKKILNL